MSNTDQARLMAHHFNHACTYQLAYRRGMSAAYGMRNIHISHVATATGQSFEAVRFLVEVATQDQSPNNYPASWVGLRTAEEIEAEFKQETEH